MGKAYNSAKVMEIQIKINKTAPMNCKHNLDVRN
jgi:hypothetical protein